MAVDPFEVLTWTCPYDGLETTEPEKHLQVHNLTIETVIEHLEGLEKERKDLARLLMMDQELATVSRRICPVCGAIKEEGDEL